MRWLDVDFANGRIMLPQTKKDEDGFCAWRPELADCQSQGETLEAAMENIKEAVELYLETLPIDERDVLLSREILTAAVGRMPGLVRWAAAEAEKALLLAG